MVPFPNRWVLHPLNYVFENCIYGLDQSSSFELAFEVALGPSHNLIQDNCYVLYSPYESHTNVL